MSFAKLLEKISSPDDRTAIEQLASRHPVLKDSFMAQDDYSRHMDELKTMRAQLDADAKAAKADKEALERWRQWSKENWDGENGLTHTEVATRRILATKDQEIEALRALVEAENVTFEELSKKLPELGVATKDDLKGVMKADDFRTKLEPVVSNLESAVSQVLPVAMKFNREFGDTDEEFDMRGFIATATQKGKFTELLNGDRKVRDEIYQDFTAPIRQRIELQKRQAELDAKAADLQKQSEELDARRSQDLSSGMGAGAHGNPVDPGAIGGGHLRTSVMQRSVMGRTDGNAPEPKLGDNTLGAAYLAKQAAGA